MDRRTTIKWMLAASVSMPLLGRGVIGVTAVSALPQGQGYGSDPDLTKIFRPGDLWPLILTPAQRRTAAALCDVIIPADSVSHLRRRRRLSRRVGECALPASANRPPDHS